MAAAFPRCISSRPPTLEGTREVTWHRNNQRFNESLKNKLGAPSFRESNGPLIAKAAFKQGLLTHPKGVNCSYDDFATD